MTISRVSVAVAAGLLIAACSPPDSVTGTVRGEGGALPEAVVRIQATDQAVVTDEDGRFMLSADGLVRVSAWAEGYFIGGGGEYRPGDDVLIELSAIPPGDNEGYEWVSALLASGGAEPCARCHSSVGSDLEYALPVDQWLADAHSGSATNPRFLTMYAGTDIHGHQSPETRYVRNRDYGLVPLRPDLAEPYFGPGYKLDFPSSDGNCGACHVPAAAVNDPHGVNPLEASGVLAEGVTCDVCHKVSDVRFDGSGVPDSGMPGVLSYEFRRPSEGHQFFAGPLDDVAPGEDAFVPLFSESAYCAACHHGVFWDTLVYDSYQQWLDSPYSDPLRGQTCQSCHMPPSGAPVFALPDEGGLVRDPSTIPGHLMVIDDELLRGAVSLRATASMVGSGVDVTVRIDNDATGHHVPTDSPLRHLILVVAATDRSGRALRQVSGPVVPDWGGVGGPADGYHAGEPGTAYAKVLEELWTEITPTGAYWNPTRVVSDNRIPAMGHDTTEYRFAAPESGEVTIEVRLLYRRAYIDLMDLKGWDVPDVVMADETLTVSVNEG